MRSSSASVLRRASTSKIASHFHQPSAQLDEPRLYFFDLNHEVTSVPWVLLNTYCQKTRFSAKTNPLLHRREHGQDVPGEVGARQGLEVLEPDGLVDRELA